MQLPPAPSLPVEHLAGAFRHTTNSYKFFWLLALLDHVQHGGGPTVPMRTLLAQMVAQAWHPVHYYRLSFGTQDRLADLTRKVQVRTALPVQSGCMDVRATTLALLQNGGSELSGDLRTLLRFVPYRFLRPWFAPELRGEPDYCVDPEIERLADERFQSEAPPLYRFTERGGEACVEIQPRWHGYLRRHLAIVEGFALWGLVQHLQRNNPNVPGLSDKLFAPEARSLSPARKVWDGVLRTSGGILCLYSGRPLAPGGYALDHFVPWSFVAHDLLWNLIPVAPEANSAKSDALPDLALYGERFAAAQHLVFSTVYASGKWKPLEDHALLFNADLPSVAAMSSAAFRERLLDGLAPLVQIAANMGFQRGWRYDP